MLQIWSADQAESWDTFVAQHAFDGGLLQSWAWGRFQESLGNAVYNVSNEGRTIVAQAIQLKAGSHWILSVPRGPVAKAEVQAEEWKLFLSDLRAFALERQCFLVRLDPPLPIMQAHLLRKAGAKKAKRERNPKQTLLVDLTKDAEVLASAMKSKWRYNIKLAEKKGVTIRQGATAEDARIFWSLVEKTTDRQGFASYNAEYFVQLLAQMAELGQARVFIAELQGQPIAALLMGYFGRCAYYLHGASDYSHRALMAPHLLQWSAMQDAKAKSYKVYDFWGVSESEWPGVTRFKQGFVPSTPFIDYVGAYELPVQAWPYALYRLRQLIKR